MLGIHDPALFAVTVLVVNATPGVDLMFTLTRTLQQGVRGGLAASLGIAAGCVLHAAAAAFGLAALLASSVAAFTVLKWLGAGYLMWLAIGLWRDAARPAGPAEPGDPSVTPTGPAAATVTRAPLRPAEPVAGSALRRTFVQALLSNALNPKIALFFLALLPQFIAPGAPQKTLAFAALAAWFIAQSLLFLAAFTLLVAPLRRRPPAAHWRRALQAGGGLLFAGLAGRLALAARP